MSVIWHKSTCPYCGFGCGIMVGVDGGKVVKTTGMKGHPTNDGRLCVFAETLPAALYAPDRLTHPMIRRQGSLVKVTWQEAIEHVAKTLLDIIRRHGPDAVAFYGGASKLTEEYYLISKLMRACIGTNNIECSTRLCMASTAAGFLSTIGADAPPACYADIEEADLFFIAGNNMAVTVPVLFQRVRAAKKANGVKVIVVDPRKTETAAIADIHLQLRPGTDVALNNALAHVLLRDGFVDEYKVQHYTSSLCDLKDFLKDYTPEFVSQITCCPPTQIVEAAHAIGRSKAMLTFWFQGYNHSSQAVFKNNTLHNLSLLTDNFCRVGAGPISITGESNALGCRFVGALSNLLPGMRLVTNATHRQEVADFWGIPVEKINPLPGRSIIDIITGLHSGEVKALFVATTNPAASLPHTRWVQEGLAKAQMLVVADIFHPTETTMLANVILPAAQWAEKTGTFVSSERRIELVEKLVQPPGDALPDYEIIWLIARQMGFEKEFPYNSPEEVFEEWKGLTRGRLCDSNGVTYQRLREGVGPQLPCPTPEHPGSARLFSGMQFVRPDGRAALLARKYIEPAETPDAEYPFMLITGRLAGQFNTRTRTGRIDRLNRLTANSFVEINTEDALALGITEGDVVEVTSRRGNVVGDVLLSQRILPGTVFIPCHFGGALGGDDNRLVNRVTNPVYDIHSKQPEFKISAVKIVRDGCCIDKTYLNMFKYYHSE
ncbi:narB, nitrate reductase [Candidatus Magnetobacterium bavaricum]|uniref:NarB, nitrate reductase n=1 Tax=Candidatus Magnetobacterium bavaricum TaxID=29290 RepID=A0A0F3H0R5_9BACT|nr:narB, nitrate reductase [Candidatus Magnetobacterium bavaricum]